MWLVTGIGGTGKSRLAFKLCDEYRKEGYDAGFLSRYQDNELISNKWSPEKPTLIIVDYAADRTAVIERFVSLYEDAKDWKHPVRVLLLERTETLLYERLRGLKGFDYATFKHMQHSIESLDIKALSRENLLDIMRQILERDPAIQHSPSDDRLWELFQKVDPKLRTLFAAYLAEVLRDYDSAIEELSHESILSYIYDRELRRWKELTGDKLYEQYVHLVYLATLAGGCKDPILDERSVQNLLPGDRYDQSTYEEIIDAHLSDENIIAPLEPDIFGEYVLLRLGLDTTRRSEKQTLSALRQQAWLLPGSTIYFVLYRMCLDLPDSERVQALIDMCLKSADTSTPKVEKMVAATKYNLGVALQELNRYKEALGFYDDAIEQNPKDAKAWSNRGITLGKQKDYKKALRAQNKACKLDPENAEFWNNKGAALDNLNRYQDAEIAYNKAIRLDKGYANAWCGLGFALAKQERYQVALRAYNKAIKLDPEGARAWCNKGVALGKLKRYEDSLKALRKASGLSSQDTEIWYNIGVAFDKFGPSYEEALSAYEKACKLDPENAKAWCNTSLDLLKLERPQEAEPACRMAITILIHEHGASHLDTKIAIDCLRDIYKALGLSDHETEIKIQDIIKEAQGD